MALQKLSCVPFVYRFHRLFELPPITTCKCHQVTILAQMVYDVYISQETAVEVTQETVVEVNLSWEKTGEIVIQVKPLTVSCDIPQILQSGKGASWRNSFKK